MHNYSVQDLKLQLKVLSAKFLICLLIISSSCTTNNDTLQMKSELSGVDLESYTAKTESGQTETVDINKNNSQKSARVGKAVAWILVLGSVVANIVLGVELVNAKEDIKILKDTIENRVNILGAAISASIVAKNGTRLLQSTSSANAQLFYEDIFFNTPNLAELAERQNWYNIVNRYNSSLNEMVENCTASTNQVSQDINNEIFKYNVTCASNVNQNKLEQQSLYNNIQSSINNIKNTLSQCSQTCIAPSYKASNGLCTTCTIAKCLQCKDTNINNPTTSCVLCAPGMCSRGHFCIGTEFSNCITCSDSTTCLSCDSESVLINSFCRFCSSEILNCLNCKTQNATVVCSKCKEGFWLSASQTSCASCSGVIPGCNYCFSDASTITKCATCANGYFLDQNNLCLPCSVTNCLSCSISNNLCDICDTKNGYWPNTDNTECRLCEDLFINCTNCYFDPVLLTTTCTSCSDGTFLSPNNICASCDSSCLACSGSATSCTDCYTSQGLFLSQLSTCLSCVAVIPNCNLCFEVINEGSLGVKTICLSCEETYCPNFMTNSCDPCNSPV